MFLCYIAVIDASSFAVTGGSLREKPLKNCSKFEKNSELVTVYVDKTRKILFWTRQN